MPNIIGEEIDHLRIDYQKWIKGDEKLGSFLLRPEDRKMCCLGFECKARGLSDTEIISQSIPSTVPGSIMGMTDGSASSDLIDKCIRINDSKRMSHKVRMRMLKEVFEQRGIKLSFYNLPKKKKG